MNSLTSSYHKGSKVIYVYNIQMGNVAYIYILIYTKSSYYTYSAIF